MLVDMAIVFKVIVESFINLIPYGLLAILPTMFLTKLVKVFW